MRGTATSPPGPLSLLPQTTRQRRERGRTANGERHSPARGPASPTATAGRRVRSARAGGGVGGRGEVRGTANSTPGPLSLLPPTTPQRRGGGGTAKG